MAQILCKTESTVRWRDEGDTSGYYKLMRSGGQTGWRLNQDSGEYLFRDGNSVGWRYKQFAKFIPAGTNGSGSSSTVSNGIWTGINSGAGYLVANLMLTPLESLSLPGTLTIDYEMPNVSTSGVRGAFCGRLYNGNGQSGQWVNNMTGRTTLIINVTSGNIGEFGITLQSGDSIYQRMIIYNIWVNGILIPISPN